MRVVRPMKRLVRVVHLALAAGLVASTVPSNVAVDPVRAAATPTLEVTWTRPGVPGTMSSPAALRVGDTVTITTDVSAFAYAHCEVSFRHWGDHREMWSFFRPTSSSSTVPCEPWTFVVPPAPPGLIEVRGMVGGTPAGGSGSVDGMTPLVEVTLEGGGTHRPFSTNYPVASWAPIDTVGTAAPSFNSPMTIRRPPGATRCSYVLNGNYQVQMSASPPDGAPCTDWSATLPDFRPAINATGPFEGPWDGYLIIHGSSLDVIPGVDMGGVSTSTQLFWDGTGDEHVASDLPAVAFLESRTPHYVLTGSTVVLDPVVIGVPGAGICQYGMHGPTTTDDGIQVELPFADGECEPYAFEAALPGNYQVGVSIRTDDWVRSGMSWGIWALDPMPAPTIEVAAPEATIPFDVSSSVGGGVPAAYEFSLGAAPSAAGNAPDLRTATVASAPATTAAAACSEGTLDYERNERTATGQCLAPRPGTYSLTARFRDVTGAVRSRTTTVYVLPAGAAGDIGGHLFEHDIRWLYAQGISTGCSSTAYCPNSAVTREQMATFLARALALPSTSRDFFTDDERSVHEGDINRLAASGITGGCGGRRFCPQSSITREQMASFLARALDLPPTSRDFFSDDERSIHEGDINRLAASGITGGCGGTRFCPRSPVTRGQMAAFLRRALGG